MFLYLLRNLFHAANAVRRPAMKLSDIGTVQLRVRPVDLDYNLHQNNARYLEAFEMGRFDMIVRCGLLSTMINQRTFDL